MVPSKSMLSSFLKKFIKPLCFFFFIAISYCALSRLQNVKDAFDKEKSRPWAIVTASPSPSPSPSPTSWALFDKAVLEQSIFPRPSQSPTSLVLVKKEVLEELSKDASDRLFEESPQKIPPEEVKEIKNHIKDICEEAVTDIAHINFKNKEDLIEGLRWAVSRRYISKIKPYQQTLDTLSTRYAFEETEYFIKAAKNGRDIDKTDRKEERARIIIENQFNKRTKDNVEKMKSADIAYQQILKGLFERKWVERLAKKENSSWGPLEEVLDEKKGQNVIYKILWITLVGILVFALLQLILALVKYLFFFAIGSDALTEQAKKLLEKKDSPGLSNDFVRAMIVSVPALAIGTLIVVSSVFSTPFSGFKDFGSSDIRRIDSSIPAPRAGNVEVGFNGIFPTVNELATPYPVNQIFVPSPSLTVKNIPSPYTGLLDELRSQLQQLDTDVKSKEDKITIAQALGSTNSNVANLKSDLTTTNSNVANLKSNLATTNSNVTNLQSQSFINTSNITNLAGSKADQSQVNQLNTQAQFALSLLQSTQAKESQKSERNLVAKLSQIWHGTRYKISSESIERLASRMKAKQADPTDPKAEAEIVRISNALISLSKKSKNMKGDKLLNLLSTELKNQELVDKWQNEILYCTRIP